MSGNFGPFPLGLGLGGRDPFARGIGGFWIGSFGSFGTFGALGFTIGGVGLLTPGNGGIPAGGGVMFVPTG